jgi:CRAL/TRIO, N-terminal domain
MDPDFQDFIPAGSSSTAMRDSSVVAVKAATASWGRLGHLTAIEVLVLSKFKSEANPTEVSNAKYTVETFDQCCLRFLRARQFDCKKALQLLSDCNQKLKEMNAETLAKLTADECAGCDTDALRNFYPHTQQGFDKLCRPILIQHTGGTKITLSTHQNQIICLTFRFCPSKI